MAEKQLTPEEQKKKKEDEEREQERIKEGRKKYPRMSDDEKYIFLNTLPDKVKKVVEAEDQKRIDALPYEERDPPTKNEGLAGIIYAETWMDLEADEEYIGRITFELFTETPKCSENFRALCTGEKMSRGHQKKDYWYRAMFFHKVIPGFCCQSGDYTRRDGRGGEAIHTNGRRFRDENFIYRHDERGLLTMANSGPNSNGSQFHIMFAPDKYMDNKHTVFGRVKKGCEESQMVLETIESLGVDYWDRDPNNPDHKAAKPTKRIHVVECGGMEKPPASKLKPKDIAGSLTRNRK